MPDVVRAARGVSRRGYRALTAPARRRAARELADAGAFDADWVGEQTGQSWQRPLQAARWYLGVGRRRGVAPHRLVEPEWIDPTGWSSGRVDPLTALLREGADARRAHPLLPAGRPLVDALSGLQPSTVLAGPAHPTYADWCGALDRAQAALSRHDGLRGRRLSTSWDKAEDRDYVTRWSAERVAPRDGPWVSVVMPVRNRPDLVVAAIRSVQRQTLGAWELLVVDDGSTDRTPEVVAGLAEADPRIRLLRREHAGVCAARNAGIDAASAPFVAFLDSDNAWTPAFLRVAVAAMSAQQLDVAHAVVEEVAHGHPRYRMFSGQEPHLWLGNFVDLNVLVCRTGALREIGGFDPTLRRMVDYDLVWRLAKRHTLHLLPFVGVHYTAHDDATDRITLTESFAWDDVVKAKNMVDWTALRGAVPRRRSDVVSVVVPARRDVAAAVATARELLDAPPSATGESGVAVRRLEVVVVDNEPTPGGWRLLWAQVGLDPRVTLVHTPVNLHRAAAVSLGLPETVGDVIVVVPAGASLGPDALRALLDAVSDDGVVAAQPAAGADTGVVAVRAAALVVADGLDPLFVNEFEVDDLLQRLAALGRSVTVDAEVRLVTPFEQPTPGEHVANVREWQRRWSGVPCPEPRGSA